MEDRIAGSLVDEFLRASAPQREKFALLATGIFVALFAFNMSVSAVLGEKLGNVNPLAMLLLLGYLGGLAWAIRRGFWTNWLPAVNAAVPSLWLLGVMLAKVTENPDAPAEEVFKTFMRGVFWFMVFTLFNGMRGSRLAIAVGAVAETLTFLVVASVGAQLASTPGAAANYQFEGSIIFFLLFANLPSILGYVIAVNLRRMAETAVRAIRAADLSGKYLVHEKLGAGGMAEAFRATYSPQGGFEKEVALKRVLPAYAQDEGFAEAFRREAHVRVEPPIPVARDVRKIMRCGIELSASRAHGARHPLHSIHGAIVARECYR